MILKCFEILEKQCYLNNNELIFIDFELNF